MAVCLAPLPAALLHHPQLLQASLGQLVHAVLCLLHPVDRRLLLHHGLDGETLPISAQLLFPFGALFINNYLIMNYLTGKLADLCEHLTPLAETC